MNQKHLWEIDHPYYCAEGNYFSNKCFTTYKSWNDYYVENKEWDIDLNLVWRWDASLQENKKFFDLKLYLVLQRKALLRSEYIYNIPLELEKEVKEYLKPFWNRMKEIWEGIEKEAGR
jgi:hypothetical protein